MQQAEDFRSYLLVLARMRLPAALRPKLDASDLVQQTLLAAHEARDGFRGSTPGERAAWLRRILAGKMADAVRALRSAKRDVGRERPLDPTLAETSRRLERWLAAEQTGPAERAERAERALRVAEALTGLPEDQQEAVLQRHWQGRSLAEIAGAMDRTEASVAGLLRRGLAALRERLGEVRP
jgi:RNA polymerase sigma-70 factor (ECF subfamily)